MWRQSCGDMDNLRTLQSVCTLLRCDDPTNLSQENRDDLEKWVNQEARAFGFDNWIDAYHWNPDKKEAPGTEAPGASTENPFPVANCEERLSEPEALSSSVDPRLPESTEECQHLKLRPEHYDDIKRNRMTFVIRKHDRPFTVNAKIVFHEYDPDDDSYTGRVLERIISYVSIYKQQAGTIVLGIQPLPSTTVIPNDKLQQKMRPLVLRTISTEGDYERAKGWLLYEVLRTMDIRRFTELVNRNIAGENFDEMVDQIIVEREGL